MKKKNVCFNLLILLVLQSVFLGADEISHEDQSVKRLGVQFNIAEDRKIEKIGGIYEPEGLDKYVKRLMDKMDARIANLEIQSAEINRRLDEIQRGIKTMVQEKGKE